MDITIKVLGEFDNVQTHISATTTSEAQIKRQLRQAISSLQAELAAVDDCPYHQRAQAAEAPVSQMDYCILLRNPTSDTVAALENEKGEVALFRDLDAAMSCASLQPLCGAWLYQIVCLDEL